MSVFVYLNSELGYYTVLHIVYYLMSVIICITLTETVSLKVSWWEGKCIPLNSQRRNTYSSHIFTVFIFRDKIRQAHMQSITFNGCAAIWFWATSGPTCLRYGFIKGELWLFSWSPIWCSLPSFHGGAWGRWGYMQHWAITRLLFGKAMEEFIILY